MYLILLAFHNSVSINRYYQNSFLFQTLLKNKAVGLPKVDMKNSKKNKKKRSVKFVNIHSK